MIGVIVNSALQPVVSEFFELFKTPWESYRTGHNYDVVLCAGNCEFAEHTARLVLIYSSKAQSFDTEKKAEVSSPKQKRVFTYKGFRLPIYGDSVTFPNGPGGLLEEGSQRPAIYSQECSGRVVKRIGYDLFNEISRLLTSGQPSANASIPSLELHIALLRDLIVEAGLTLIEIPPVPDGHRFIACLTHDIDHPSIRKHKFDHTMLGFLYRALFGSVFELVRGRIPFRKLLVNWMAALKLPFVHLGLTADFWSEFDGYAELETGLHSTFFVIPFKNSPGRRRKGKAPRRRAARYEPADIAGQIRKLISKGCEIGLHGIDAWIDSSSAQKELEQIRRVAGTQSIGIRMHWLFTDEQAPSILEQAGIEYDSTAGFNETIGYRAGTTQAYKPLSATTLLEWPLHIMDTALFFPSYLDLSTQDARKRVSKIIDNAVEFGGGVTVNWHDRSIAPERLWGDFYMEIIEMLRVRGAWFSTASQAVSWFRRRRRAVFETASEKSGAVRIIAELNEREELPGMQLRVHRQGSFQDIPIGEGGAEDHDKAYCVDNHEDLDKRAS